VGLHAASDAREELGDTAHGGGVRQIADDDRFGPRQSRTGIGGPRFVAGVQRHGVAVVGE